MDRCRGCDGELPAQAAKCPHCGQAASPRQSSNPANVIALLVVLFILVVVGSLAMGPGHPVEHAKVAAEAAGKTTAASPAKPGHGVENAGAARLSPRPLHAQRMVPPYKR